MQILLHTIPGEKFFDFSHIRYTPRVSYAHKLRPLSLLFNSFPSRDKSGYFAPLIRKLHGACGLNGTVFGVKLMRRRLSWEFYFYNRQNDPEKKISSLLRIIKHKLSNISVCDKLPYFMFSIDFDQYSFSRRSGIEGVNIYIKENKYSPAANSYYFNGHSLRLLNHYYFFNPKEEHSLILGKLENSAFLDPQGGVIKDILLPQANRLQGYMHRK